VRPVTNIPNLQDSYGDYARKGSMVRGLYGQYIPPSSLDVGLIGFDLLGLFFYLTEVGQSAFELVAEVFELEHGAYARK